MSTEKKNEKWKSDSRAEKTVMRKVLHITKSQKL